LVHRISFDNPHQFLSQAERFNVPAAEW